MNSSITIVHTTCLKRMRIIVIAAWTLLAALTIFWECRDNVKLKEAAAINVIHPMAALEQGVARSNLNHIGIILTVWLFGIARVIYMFRDIMRLTGELADEQHNVDVLFEGSPMPQLLFDDQLKIVRFNEAQRRLCLDFDPLASYRCGSFFQCVNAAIAPEGCGSATNCSVCTILKDLRRVSLHGGRASGEARISSEFQPDCLQDIYLLYSLSAIAFKGGNRVVMSYIDITARKKDEQEHRLAYRVLSQANEGVFLFDGQLRLVYVNDTACRSLGYSREELLTMTIPDIDLDLTPELAAMMNELFTAGTLAVLESRYLTKDGRFLPVEISASGFEHDGITFTLCMTRDISERKIYQGQLHKLAYSDPLTSLPNRTLYWDRLTLALQDAVRNDENLGVMFIDLDCFKEVNDTLGHDTGDKLLKIVASRFSDTLRPQDTVARLGGDEFAILVSQVRHEVDLAIIARKLLATFREPVVVSGRELFITASIGIASFPSDSRDTTGLLCCADVAMYHAKASGKNNFKFYSIALTHAATERMELENDLRKALLQGELEVYYQPKVHSIIGQIIGAEALLRWNHPARGMVLPDKFIGIAEDTGLICDIGVWVLHNACVTVVNWNKGALRPVKVAVNISARQLVSGDFSDRVRATMLATGCRPEWLELEITESVLMSRTKEVVATLEELDSLGIDIAIDDFGTGYSSLSYLTEFPVKIIKIDKEFVKDIVTDKRKLELIRAIVSMGSKLGIEVVAEGVASGEQAACLVGLGCHIFQGYYFGRPMSLARFDDWWSTFSVVRPAEGDGVSPVPTLAGRDEYLYDQRCCNE